MRGNLSFDFTNKTNFSFVWWCVCVYVLIAESSGSYAEEYVASGTVYLGSANLNLGLDYPNNDEQIVAVRFPKLAVPACASECCVFKRLPVHSGFDLPSLACLISSEVVSATLQFVDRQVLLSSITSTPLVLRLWGHRSPDSPDFTSSAQDVSSRLRTSEIIDWNVPAWIANGDRSTDQRVTVTTLVQEVVSMSSWQV